MNIAFYVSGTAGRLQKIINQADEEVINSIKTIFSDDNRNAFLDQIAKDKGITYSCLHYEDIEVTPERPKSAVMSDTLLGLLREHDIDYCFSFGDHLLVGDLLEQYKNKIINFHPSILPMFPGLKSIDQAVEANANVLGNTAHFVDAGTDTGPVIMQSVIPSQVFTGNNYDTVLDLQLAMFNQIFKWLKADRIVLKDAKVEIKGADYGTPAFFPELENEE